MSIEEANKMEPPYANQLIHQSSPYLLEHAHNPVNWYPWGEDALQKAKSENKPLIISIGYASCHWCHVMEKECYSDEEVAEYMNAHFVSIKIDREERPDIDQIYMNASMMLNGSGGWPLNAFTLPDGKPFYVVTYLPKAQWLQLLKQIVALSENKAEDLKTQAETVAHGVATHQMFPAPKEKEHRESAELYDVLYKKMASMVDFETGGLKRSPKFPLPVAWEWMLQEYYVHNNKEALEATETTLRNMALGGIYDQLEGGFARYSTDGYWFAPHFEKMLYDNGQLVSLYAHAYKITGQPLYKEVIEETLSFVEKELMDKNGGFYSSVNADSEGEEGKFYVWTAEEIKEILPKETADLILSYYQIKPDGNWEENKNILYPSDTLEEFAKKKGLEEKKWREILEEAKSTLLKIREQRIAPTVDNKILVSWNALMLKGYIDAYQTLGVDNYLQTAIANAKFLAQNMLQKEGRILRNYMNGKAHIDGLLEDYAFLAEAYISLYQVTFDKQWLDLSDKLIQYVITHFQDSKSPLYFYTSDQSERLIARKKEVEDNVIPASNSVLASVLYKLGNFFDQTDYIRQSKEMLKSVQREIPSAVPYFAQWAKLLGEMSNGGQEIAILGEAWQQKCRDMQKEFLPLSLWMGGEEEHLPLLKDKLVKGKTMIYVCKNRVWRQPTEKVKDALSQIKERGG